MAKNINKVILSGRTTRDCEVRYTQGEKPMCISRNSLACDRGKNADGESTADFIPIVAFGKCGEIFEKYVTKGTKLNILGHLQTGSYTNKEGNKVYTWEVVVDEVEMLSSNSGSNASAGASAPAEDTMDIPDDIGIDFV